MVKNERIYKCLRERLYVNAVYITECTDLKLTNIKKNAIKKIKKFKEFKKSKKQRIKKTKEKI